MIFHKLPLQGLYLIDLELREDERGYFTRNFCLSEFEDNKINFPIKQTNLSFTKDKGTIRGMHFQKKPKEEGKIIQCIKGTVYDVAVDIREASPTYGKWQAVELSEDNHKMFYIPEGFAHGFQTLTDNCELLYYMSEVYSPNEATGIRWNDSYVGIEWPMNCTTISEKDKLWPLIKK